MKQEIKLFLTEKFEKEKAIISLKDVIKQLEDKNIKTLTGVFVFINHRAKEIQIDI